MKVSRLLDTVVVMLLSTGCSAPSTPAPAPTAPSTPTDLVELPPTSGVFDYQLGGASEYVSEQGPSPTVVVRDNTAEPLPGAYNICYVNGFQTQPTDATAWLQRQDLLLQDAHGKPITDPEWPDEYILDPSAQHQRAGILAVTEPLLADCAKKGYDAVEIDNLDTFERFGGIDASGAMALAADYVRIAHKYSLAIGQKNAAETSRRAHTLGFDFAVTEECGAYDECQAYTGIYGEHVLQIEYPESLKANHKTFEHICSAPERAPLTILRDRPLAPTHARGRTYQQCSDGTDSSHGFIDP